MYHAGFRYFRMSHPYSDILSWIDSQHQQMILLVTRWAEINSGTGNVDGPVAHGQ